MNHKWLQKEQFVGPLGFWGFPAINTVLFGLMPRGNPVGRGPRLGGPRVAKTGIVWRGTPSAAGRSAPLTVTTTRPPKEEQVVYPQPIYRITRSNILGSRLMA